jgi:hypothetical protein
MYLDSICVAFLNVHVQHLHLIYGKMTVTVKGELNYCQGNG